MLFVKPTAAGKAFLGKPEEKSPFPGAKKWFYIEGDRWEDADWMSGLIRATAPQVAPVKKKMKKAVSKADMKAVKQDGKKRKAQDMTTQHPEIFLVEASAHQVCCNGGGALGHPKVYYTFDGVDEVTCGYCDRLFTKHEQQGAKPYKAA